MLTSYVGAALALLATLGFLSTLGVLSFHLVPEGNKDPFNTCLTALINLCCIAFGYYLGSSAGSARKTDLFYPEPEPASPAPKGLQGSEAGYFRIEPLLWVLLGCSLLVMASCATLGKDSPQVSAGKSLLAVKASIVTAATATDALCQARQLPSDICLQAEAAYTKAKPAYDSAVDAYLLMSTGGDPAAYQAAIIRVQDIANNLLLLSGGAK
jgi:hypothetical protein